MLEYNTPTTMNCRELYAVVDTESGRLHFSAKGAAYKTIKTVTNKMNELKERYGDHFKIVTYYLGKDFEITPNDLMEFLEV